MITQSTKSCLAILPLAVLGWLAGAAAGGGAEPIPNGPGAAGRAGVVTDAATGVRFHKIREFTNDQEVIESRTPVTVSPNGRYLMCPGRLIGIDAPGVVPLDLPGGAAWNPAAAVWSWDGRQMAWVDATRRLWMSAASPDTGQPVGPAREVPEAGLQAFPSLALAPDGSKLFCIRSLKKAGGTNWASGISSVPLPGNAAPPGVLMERPSPIGRLACSPDGQWLAFQDPKDGRQATITLLSLAGGTPRDLDLPGTPLGWSADSAWLASERDGRLTFVRVRDGRTGSVNLPPETGRCLGADHRGNLYFFRAPPGAQTQMRLWSLAGAPPVELPLPLEGSVRRPQWAPGGGAVVFEETTEAAWKVWALPTNGQPLQRFAVDVKVAGTLREFRLSPDGAHCLLVTRSRGPGGQQTLWVAPVSLKEWRTTGPARQVLEGLRPGGIMGWSQYRWLPEGKTVVAVAGQGDLWLAHLDGRSERLARLDQEIDLWDCSPDGQILAYETSGSAAAAIGVISLEDRLPMAIYTPREALWLRGCWGPDSRSLLTYSEGAIRQLSLGAGAPVTLRTAEQLGIDSIWDFCRSPKGGQAVILAGRNISRKVLLCDLKTRAFRTLQDEPASGCAWSPDGQWVACPVARPAQARLPGILWKASLAEMINRLR